jgi:hypothetical protein
MPLAHSRPINVAFNLSSLPVPGTLQLIPPTKQNNIMISLDIFVINSQ